MCFVLIFENLLSFMHDVQRGYACHSTCVDFQGQLWELVLPLCFHMSYRVVTRLTQPCALPTEPSHPALVLCWKSSDPLMSSVLPLTVILFYRNKGVGVIYIKKLLISTRRGDVCFSNTVSFILYFNVCLTLYFLISFHNDKIKTLYMLIKFKNPSFVFMGRLSSISVALKLCISSQNSEL